MFPILQRFAFLFLLIPVQVVAGNFGALTKDETVKQINFILTSNYRYYYAEYNYDGSFHKKVTCADSWFSYWEFYRKDSTLERKGLKDHRYYPGETGTWWFYDADGKLFKEFDFSTCTKTLFGIKEEPFAVFFDSVYSKSRSDLSVCLGLRYTERHVRISAIISWSCHAEGELASGNYPEMPTVRPHTYRINADVVYHDSIVVESFQLQYDSLLQLVSIGYDHPDSIRRKTFLVDYGLASFIAKNHGYSNLSLSWNSYHNDFYWHASRCMDPLDPQDGPVCRFVAFSAHTGKPMPYRKLLSHETSCPTFTEFTTPCADVRTVTTGQKKIDLEDVSLIVPLNWFVSTTYSGYSAKSFVTNGTDTLHGYNTCGRMLKKAYMYDTEYDTSCMNKMARKFPGNKIQGRSYQFSVVKTGTNTYELDMLMEEDISALGCGAITYHYFAEGITKEQAAVLTDILLSMQFSMCIPADE